MISSNEINTITKNIQKYKDIYFDNLSKEFNNFTNKFIEDYESQLNTIIDFITSCDLLQNRCYIAETYSYCKPNIINNPEKSFIDFKQLRHPLIEKINTNEIYISNDLSYIYWSF